MATKKHGRQDHPGHGRGRGRAVRGRASGDSERAARRQPGQPPGSRSGAASGREHGALRRHGHDGRAWCAARRWSTPPTPSPCRSATETLGRIMNVVGDPVDEARPHRVPSPPSAPSTSAGARAFIDQSTDTEILVTGIKVVDLLAPYAKGGKVGLFGGAGVGKTVHDHGADQQHRQGSMAAIRCSPAWASARARATTSIGR